jgi:hypothetical protein
MVEERNTPASSTWQTPMGSRMIAANMRRQCRQRSRSGPSSRSTAAVAISMGASKTDEFG